MHNTSIQMLNSASAKCLRGEMLADRLPFVPTAFWVRTPATDASCFAHAVGLLWVFLSHARHTRPRPIMLSQLYGMSGLTRKNVLVFQTSNKPGLNPHPPSDRPPYHIVKTQMLFSYEKGSV